MFQGPCYRALKALEKGSSGFEADPLTLADLESALTKAAIPKGLQQKVRFVVKRLTTGLLGRALQTEYVKDGFKRSGWHPYDPVQILTRLRGWKHLKPDLKALLQKSIPHVEAIAR